MNYSIIDLSHQNAYSNISSIDLCNIDNNGYKLVKKQIEITEGREDDIKASMEKLKEIADRCTLIVKDSEIDVRERKCYIYTEYVENGSLKEMIRKKSDKKEDFFLQV